MIGVWLQRIALVAPLLVAVAPAAAQVAVGTLQGSISYALDNGSKPEPRPVTGWIAYLDISSGSFAPTVTGPASPACSAPDTVRMQQTNLFATQYGTLVTITANTGASTPPEWACGEPDGLLVSNGTLVNPPQPKGPILYLLSNSEARITTVPIPAIPYRNAVAGTTTTGLEGCPPGQQIGTLLVQDGKPGACAIPKPTVIAPRGAIGLDSTGKYLIIVIIQGDESNNLGLKTKDFAQLMIALHAQNAVNFDGGGSTTFVWQPGNPVPQPDETLVNWINGASVPPNPHKLTITGKAVPVDQGYCSNSLATLDFSACTQNTGSFRPVYASFGETYKPAAKR